MIAAGPPKSTKSPDAANAAPDPAIVVPKVDESPAAPTLVPESLGFSGGAILPPTTDSPAQAIPDRWRTGWPSWDRYGKSPGSDALLQNASGGDSPYTRGNLLNPYDRNVLKGDYPILGNNLFMNVSAVSDTLYLARRLPTPSGPSASDSGAFDFFGDGRQDFVSQTVLLSLELFQGNTSFRPPDWLVRVTAASNWSFLKLRENGGVNIDVREGDERNDSFQTLQEAFLECHLGDTSQAFDVAEMRIGRQLFVSDFRGFIYSDVADGFRLFGNAESNRIQYNLLVVNQNVKDTNSELSELNWRNQQVVIANTYIQDFIFPGYTAQFSVHWNHDQSNREFDSNGFQVIPDLAGSARPHNIDAVYFGMAGDGHIGRLNVNHAFYYVTGHDSDNPIAGRAVDLSAYMGAIECSVDVDWLRPKASFLYASGDRHPTDGRATGFDGIQDNPSFAGGPSSFYQNSAFRLFGVDLTGSRSLYFDMAGTKAEGQANYVNPGTMLVNFGLDAEITPKLRASLNCNSIWFAETETVAFFTNQRNIHQHFGDEINLSLQYRPLLNNNVILTVGGSVFFPGNGFQDIYDSKKELWQVFTGLTLTF